MAIENRLKELMKDPACPIKEVICDLEPASNGKVGGFIISPTFKGMPQIERQNMVWNYLDHNLNQQQILHIVSLVTVTPDEFEEN